jgi:nitroimidazol reductase NimA-like FMN-containing flavoprotein (pyridoxamine 5'-phosphate oxidase superfamily)
MRRLPPEAAAVLDHGTLCHVVADGGRWPHLTPVVYAMHASRMWLTTSRRSVKARAWKRRPEVAGMVRAGDHAVSFAGTVRLHDGLDLSTWVPSAASLPTLALAAAAFTRKNARFFAGYAVDARRVPLAWTPPGRVFVEVRIDALALLDDWGGEPRTWGGFGDRVRSHGEFRQRRSSAGPFDALPPEVGERLGSGGPAVLAVRGADGPVVLPGLFAQERGVLYGAVDARSLALARAGPDAPAALTVDRASRWRARDMTGALVQGTGGVHVLDCLRLGRREAERIVERAGALPEGMALVRLGAERLVWWRGWSSGTVDLRRRGRPARRAHRAKG